MRNAASARSSRIDSVRIASVRPDNEASLGLVRGFGFVQTGTQMDDIDGLELVLEAEWPPAEAAAG